MLPTTRESATWRRPVVAYEPLMYILSPHDERWMRFQLSSGSFGGGGGIVAYGDAGAFSVAEADRLCGMVRDRREEDLSHFLRGVRSAVWGRGDL